tara:strand:- start:339 stop:545 length:207 start_codon:yes stop_codon:yes gene_type:complete
MPKYKVTATSMKTLFVEIEAKNKQAAWEEGCDMEGDQFEEDGMADWQMSDVYLIEGEEPEESDDEEED